MGDKSTSTSPWLPAMATAGILICCISYIFCLLSYSILSQREIRNMIMPGADTSTQPPPASSSPPASPPPAAKEGFTGQLNNNYRSAGTCFRCSSSPR